MKVTESHSCTNSYKINSIVSSEIGMRIALSTGLDYEIPRLVMNISGYVCDDNEKRRPVI